MKPLVFLLGFVMGTLTAYLILTRVWWPDVRLAQAHRESEPIPPPLSAPTPSTPLPSALETPPTIPLESSPEPTVNPTVDPSASPGIAMLPSSPLPTPVEAPPGTAAPRETLSVTLPILETDIDRLRDRALVVPVQGIAKKALRDTFGDDRSGEAHQAMDIMASRGTPVLAVDDGRIEKLFTSKRGGLTLYQFDSHRDYCYYYAHLDRYAAGIEAGLMVRKGDVIGYVGSTGNAAPEAPHLHFTIFRLGAEKRWWEGTAVNPYPLWSVSPAVAGH